MSRLFWLTLLSGALWAQNAAPPDLRQLTSELRNAIQSDSLNSAVEFANRLDEAVQQRYRGWLTRDASQRLNEVLAWLPNDMESFWANQEPFTINADESIQLLSGRPLQLYFVDRLMALNGGAFYRALTTQTVRIVAAATRSVREGQFGIPGPMNTQDVVYFYLFANPVAFPQPDGSLLGLPVWRATAMIQSSEVPQPGGRPKQQADENWLALARPDLLVLTNRHELLVDILERFTAGSKNRAFPAELEEWNHVDLNAPFWGLRHYTIQSKPRAGEASYDAAELPKPDGTAVGVTVRFDSAQQKIEIDYLSKAELAQRRGFGDTLSRQFRIGRSGPGVWRLESDIQERGPWPVHFAMSMLGFGEYR